MSAAMPKTQAEIIRAAAKRSPKLTPAQLAAKLGVSDGAVRSALRSRYSGRGRPTGDVVRVHLSIPRSVYDRARAEAERDGVSVEDVLRSAIESGVVPAEKWHERGEHVGAAERGK